LLVKQLPPSHTIRCVTPNIWNTSSKNFSTGPTLVFRTALRQANFVNPSMATIS
jgi:hypothetical protein